LNRSPSRRRNSQTALWETLPDAEPKKIIEPLFWGGGKWHYADDTQDRRSDHVPRAASSSFKA
jgi:hypothetical protein